MFIKYFETELVNIGIRQNKYPIHLNEACILNKLVIFLI